MTKIALLCPTRGRPEQCRRMIESAQNTALENPHIFISIQEDAENSAYAYNYSQKYKDVHYACTPSWPTVQSWNYLAQWAMKFPEINLFMLAADDMIFETSWWDKALIDHYNSLENKIHVYALQDSRDPDGTPHIIVSREYINALGYFVPPIFLHWFCDTWTVAIAKSNGCFTHFRDFKLTHDKPSDQGKPDETHSRIRRMGFHERDKYVAETCAHFLEAEKLRLDNYLRRKEDKRWQA